MVGVEKFEINTHTTISYYSVLKQGTDHNEFVGKLICESLVATSYIPN